MNTNTLKKVIQVLMALTLVLGSVSCSSTGDSPKELPKVLLIGDFLGNQYFNYVIGLQDGRIDIRRPLSERGGALNCEGTTKGVAEIESWLGDEEWDLIYFNFGLHDLMHVDPDNIRRGSSNPDHPQQASPDQYEANLKTIAQRLKQTGAQLVFANIIPIRESNSRPLRRADQVEVYNRIAAGIMEEEGIEVHDMNAFFRPRMDELLATRGLALNSRGYLEMALETSGYLEKTLNVAGRPDRGQTANVLLLGDSVSLGYTPFVRGMLYDEADVFRPLNEGGGYLNCAGTLNGLANMDAWLSSGKWDVIHFNFGLHDLKHVYPGQPNKNSKDPNHPQQSDPKAYEANLRSIVTKLKATGAALIFANTTPFPDEPGGPLRRADQAAIYNEIAGRIMEQNGIPVNNLHDFVKPQMDALMPPKDVHFNQKGSQELAKQVVTQVREALDRRKDLIAD